MVIGIIGGGASGMAAALAAAENSNAEVIVFERQARVGKKLLATGNGRCNLSNIHASQGGYHGEAPEFADYALSQFSPGDTLQWFRSMGLFTVTEDSGKVYPYSDHANSVVDVLRLAMEKDNIRVLTGYEVKNIRPGDGGFWIDDQFCHRVIVACGGLAGTKLGGSMAGYKLLAKFGHKSTRLRPALVQLKTGWSGVTALKGVRTNCSIAILWGGEKFRQSAGELQFTDYGISGPVVFEISRDVCYGGGEWAARVDFLPHISGEQLLEELLRRQQTDLPMEELLTGILHNRLGRVLTKAAGVKEKSHVSQLAQQELEAVIQAVKCFDISLTEPMGMDNAQVTAGGVLTDGFDPHTMESKLVSGLYACGEVLDIDGDCGGYNLQWAWSSGRLAGQSAGKECI